MIKAEIVCDSVAPSGVRLTTFVVTYPRFIHAEFMTHRVFSRNASSSRAIPVKKQIEMIEKEPVIPIAFRKNRKGMQAGELLDNQEEAVRLWLEGRDRAVDIAKRLADLEVHKQYANRVLEPYAHITVVVTATDWDNFFALRCHEAAQPEIHALADLMYDAYLSSTPRELVNGMWHMPFAGGMDWSDLSSQEHLKCSVARCARVSYLNHDKTEPTPRQDFELYERLVGNAPLHASPAEHQAMAIGDASVRSGNFRGWIQYRKTLKNENVTGFRKADG
jgi:thymidylate synthase ThyX